jgi:hypothetical protein
MTPEQRPRVSIDALLVQAGWHFCNVANANLYAQHQGKLEMFRGKLGAVQQPHAFDDGALAAAWDDWVALDPANAQRDALQEPGWRHVRARTARSAQRNNWCRVAVRHLP